MVAAKKYSEKHTNGKAKTVPVGNISQKLDDLMSSAVIIGC